MAPDRGENRRFEINRFGRGAVRVSF